LTRERPNGTQGGVSAAPLPASRRTLSAWAVAGVACVCYANSLPNGFVYDSIQIVERNPLVQAPGRWLDLWTVDHWYQEEGRTADRDLLYRPVALWSYRAVRSIAGSGPFPQHLVNVLLHGIVSVLVLLAAVRLGFSWLAGATAGLLFAVLPIHTEVVDDVVGRTDLLATLGILLTLAAHHRLTRARGNAARGLWMMLATAAGFVALGSKESGVSVLLLVLLFDAFGHVERRGGSPSERWVSRRTIARLSYLVIPAMVYLLLRYHALEGRLFQQPAATKSVNQLVDAAPWQHALGVMQAWGMYWAKTLWPAVLCPDYSVNAVRLATGADDAQVAFGTVVAAVLAGASVLAWRRGRRAVAFCVMATVIAYGPASNVFILAQTFFAERIWYLPSVWVVMLLAGAITGLRPRGVWLAALVLGGAAMFGRCWIRNPEWKSNAVLAAAAHRDHPDAVATLVMYGNHLATTGRLERGLALLQRAVEIDPGFTVAHRALAKAYGIAGDLERSLYHWRIAEMQLPGHPEVVTALRVTAELLASRREEELRAVRAAAEERPQDVEAELAYLGLLLELGRHDEALARMTSTEARFGQNSAWQRQAAVALLFAGRRDAAVARYRRAIELAPTDPATCVELAALLLDRRLSGDQEEAEGLVQRAMDLAPLDPAARIMHAETLALRGEIRRALQVYASVLDSLPADHPHRPAWVARARVLGQR